MTYSVKLVNPKRFFFDHEAKLFLDYYRPSGTTNVLTDTMKLAIKTDVLRDMTGAAVAAIKAEDAPLEEATEEQLKELDEAPKVEVPEATKEDVKEEVKEDVKAEEKVEEDNHEPKAEEKAATQKKAVAKRTSKKAAPKADK